MALKMNSRYINFYTRFSTQLRQIRFHHVENRYLYLEKRGNCPKYPWTSLLHCRLPYFTKSACLGFLQQVAHKHASYNRGNKSGKSSDDDDIDSEVLDPSTFEDADGKDVKVIKSRLNSLRLDSLLKAGLGISKNKVETAFYESRIRVNGERVLKKSKQLKIGDEVDVIRGYNTVNPKFLDISRVIIIAAEDSEDEKIPVVLKRYKLLTIENYVDPYKRVAE